MSKPSKQQATTDTLKAEELLTDKAIAEKSGYKSILVSGISFIIIVLMFATTTTASAKILSSDRSLIDTVNKTKTFSFAGGSLFDLFDRGNSSNNQLAAVESGNGSISKMAKKFFCSLNDIFGDGCNEIEPSVKPAFAINTERDEFLPLPTNEIQPVAFVQNDSQQVLPTSNVSVSNELAVVNNNELNTDNSFSTTNQIVQLQTTTTPGSFNNGDIDYIDTKEALALYLLAKNSNSEVTRTDVDRLENMIRRQSSSDSDRSSDNDSNLASTVSSILSGTNISGQMIFNGLPTGGSAVDQGLIYINPASANPTDTLLGIAVAGSELFRVDASGDIYGNNLTLSGDIESHNITPAADSTYSIGTNLLRWANLFTDTLTSGTATLTSGSLTDSSGSISFGDENLSTTGTLGVGGATTLSSTVNVSGLLTASSGINVNSETITDFTGAGLSLSGGALTMDQSSVDAEDFSTSLSSGSIVFSNGSNFTEDNANLFWDDTNNRLGIGTTSPDEQFHIGSDFSNTNIKISNFGYLGHTSGGLATILGNNAKSDSNALRVAETGGNGARAIEMIYSDGIKFFADGGAVTAGNALTERMRITNSGDVGIGTNSPAQKLDVAGTVRQSNAISCSLDADANGDIICTPSDQNLKDSNGKVENALDMITNLNPIYYTWKDKDRFGAQREIGFFAQEVRDVLPEATIHTGDYLSLNYSRLTALNLAGIKELQSIDTEITVTVDSLDARLTTLEEKVDNIPSYRVPGDSTGSKSAIAMILEKLDVMTTSVGSMFNKLFVRELVVVKPETGNTMSSPVGQVIIKSGDKEVVIENNLIKSTSQVVITPRSAVSDWYLSDVADGQFTISVKSSVSKDTKFDYWIIGIVESNTNSTSNTNTSSNSTETQETINGMPVMEPIDNNEPEPTPEPATDSNTESNTNSESNDSDQSTDSTPEPTPSNQTDQGTGVTDESTANSSESTSGTSQTQSQTTTTNQTGSSTNQDSTTTTTETTQ